MSFVSNLMCMCVNVPLAKICHNTVSKYHVNALHVVVDAQFPNLYIVSVLNTLYMHSICVSTKIKLRFEGGSFSFCIFS